MNIFVASTATQGSPSATLGSAVEPRWGTATAGLYAKGVTQHSPGSPKAHPGFTTRPLSGSYAESVAQPTPGSPRAHPGARPPEVPRPTRCSPQWSGDPRPARPPPFSRHEPTFVHALRASGRGESARRRPPRGSPRARRAVPVSGWTGCEPPRRRRGRIPPRPARARRAGDGTGPGSIGHRTRYARGTPAQALAELVHGFAVATEAVEGDAQRVVADRGLRQGHDRAARQRHGDLGVALERGTGRQPPGFVVGVLDDGGVSSAQRAVTRGGSRLVSQGLETGRAQLVQGEIMGIERRRIVEVGQGLAVPSGPLERAGPGSRGRRGSTVGPRPRRRRRRPPRSTGPPAAGTGRG